VAYRYINGFFRNRIGTEGIELIFKESIRINGKDGREQEATTDTTVKEKNITYPTDSKLHRKIIKNVSPLQTKKSLNCDKAIAGFEKVINGSTF